MHKKLNIFEYQISKEKKIELTTIQISNLFNEILQDIDYLKYELNNQSFINYLMKLMYHNQELKDELEAYMEDYVLDNIDYVLDNEELKDKLIKSILDNEELKINTKRNLKKSTNSKNKNLKKKRNYNPNTKIKNLFDKYYDKTKTKKEILQIIAKELSLSYKAVEKAYYKKSNS